MLGPTEEEEGGEDEESGFEVHSPPRIPRRWTRNFTHLSFHRISVFDAEVHGFRSSQHKTIIGTATGKIASTTAVSSSRNIPRFSLSETKSAHRFLFSLPGIESGGKTRKTKYEITRCTFGNHTNYKHNITIIRAELYTSLEDRRQRGVPYCEMSRCRLTHERDFDFGKNCILLEGVFRAFDRNTEWLSTDLGALGDLSKP